MFAGSFNPFTAGHADIARRALKLFDRLIIAVGVNAAKDCGSGRERAAEIERVFAGEPRVLVRTYSGLTADFARKNGACALVRGVRGMRDFEYERDMAQINSLLCGIETVLLPASAALTPVSSSLVRELKGLGVDTSQFMP